MTTDAVRIRTIPDTLYETRGLAAGYRVGDVLYLSGMTGMGDDGKIAPGGFAAQCDQMFRNIQRILQAGGSDLSRVFKTTTFVTGMQYRDDWIAAKQRWFTAPMPAGTLVEVSRFGSAEALVELEVIALADGRVVG